MRRWWLTIVLNLVIVSAVAVGCSKSRAPAPPPPAPADTSIGIVLVARDDWNPYARQDHWRWTEPDSGYGVAEYYTVEYRFWGGEWFHLGTTATNEVLVPQRYSPYQIRVTAYFGKRLWLDPPSAGIGAASTPSDWVEKYTRTDERIRHEEVKR